MANRRSEALAFSLVTGINLAMARLVDIWDSIGIMEEQRVERMEAVKKHIDDLLNEMITEEENLKHRIERSIITCKKQLETLHLELSVEPYKIDPNLTVLQLEKDLRTKMEALMKEKNDRLKELETLQQDDNALCTELCATPYYIPTGSMPSRSQLQDLREHIKSLKEEKKNRIKVFSDLRQDIRRLMTEIGHSPETSMEKEVVCDDTDAFLLTNENIKALKMIVFQMEVKKESLTLTRDELKDKVLNLSNRLGFMEQGKRLEEKPAGSLSDEIVMWQNELEHLEELKKANLEEVIKKIRVELAEYWDKCRFSSDQRDSFKYFYDDNFTEELLMKHDEELLQVKMYYEKCKPLLETVERWEKNFAIFQEFERRASDPNRFSNRGGTLLKEVKERVKIQKLLPKLEEELKSSIEMWEAEQGTEFLFGGLKVMDYIANHWDEHRLLKGKEKNERVKKDTSAGRTPGKRPHGGLTIVSTPNKTKKVAGTQNFSVLRVTSSSSSSSSNNSTASTFHSVSGKPPLSIQKTQLKGRILDVAPRTPLQEFNSEKRTVRIGSYTEFTKELSQKSHPDTVLNSTAKDIIH